VRDIKNNKKMKCVLNGFGIPNMAGTVEIIETNLKSDKNWNKATQGCNYVLHIASPISVFHNVKPESDEEERLIA